MLICLWAPVQLLQVHPQFWVELESEGSLVAFSEIGYHHFTSSPVDSKWPHPPKGISMLTNHVLYGKKKWWKLGVLILKKWKVHTNTAKSKGLGFLSKAKKKTLTSSWCVTYLHMVGIIQGVFVFFIGVKYMDLSLGCLHHTLGLQLSWVFLFTSRGKGVLSRESLV